MCLRDDVIHYEETWCNGLYMDIMHRYTCVILIDIDFTDALRPIIPGGGGGGTQV